MRKQYAVIGLGRFGSSVARSLSQAGHEVLAVDSSESIVQEISSAVTHAVQADSTDEEALKALGISEFDVVVVAIGVDMQASILTTILLRELGVKTIIAKSISDLHGKVLKKIGADKVVFPERDMGNRVAHHLISSHILDLVELSKDHSIIEIQATERLIGRNIRELDIRAKYNCNVIAVKNGDHLQIPPDADMPLRQEDVLVMLGANSDLQKFNHIFVE